MSANATSLPDIDSLWDYNDPAATEAQFRALLPRVQAEGDADYEAELLTQLARAQGLGVHGRVDVDLTLERLRLRGLEMA